MPLTHTRTFRVRHYECDPFGIFSPVNFLRYTQEAAFDASTAAGYSKSRYAALNRLWVIRTSEIEYLQPAFYDDCIAVKTWIADFRRATSRRMYAITRSESGELLAHGYSDWVYVDSASGAPAAIPHEVQTSFFPEGLPDSFPPRSQFPAAPPPPPYAAQIRREVTWHDLDPAGHVNNAMYLDFAVDAWIQTSGARGRQLEAVQAGGLTHGIRKHQLQHLQSALLGDTLEITFWDARTEQPGAADLPVRYTLLRRVNGRGEAGELLARINSYPGTDKAAAGSPA